jgi:hypothetical protein
MADNSWPKNSAKWIASWNEGEKGDRALDDKLAEKWSAYALWMDTEWRIRIWRNNRRN